MYKPSSSACERNREPILGVLRKVFADRRRVLEIGSGTGQHAVHFAAALPWLTWQCSDRSGHLAGIHAWLDEAALSNTPPPLALDVSRDWALPLALAQTHSPELPQAAGGCFDAAFSANTLHIMAWPEVRAMFAGLDAALAGDATVVIYGPFNRNGTHTSDSNRAFDTMLRARDPASGLRDLEVVDGLARAIGLRLCEDVEMPANNRCLVWRRAGA